MYKSDDGIAREKYRWPSWVPWTLQPAHSSECTIGGITAYVGPSQSAMEVVCDMRLIAILGSASAFCAGRLNVVAKSAAPWGRNVESAYR